MRGDKLLATVGTRVRAMRDRLGWSRRELSQRCGVSERFLAQLEAGDGNISLVRFAEVAAALGSTPAELLADATPRPETAPIALLGVRGAGKSTIGPALAQRLNMPFVEVDQRIEQVAGLRLAEIFELHGEAYYRRLEREVLMQLLADGIARVLATGGSIVNDPTNYGLLRERCRTIWLRARPEDHWNRVVAQGDQRPMQGQPRAMGRLREILNERSSLYGLAQHVVDTSALGLAKSGEKIEAIVRGNAAE